MTKFRSFGFSPDLVSQISEIAHHFPWHAARSATCRGLVFTTSVCVIARRLLCQSMSGWLSEQALQWHGRENRSILELWRICTSFMSFSMSLVYNFYFWNFFEICEVSKFSKLFSCIYFENVSRGCGGVVGDSLP